MKDIKKIIIPYLVALVFFTTSSIPGFADNSMNINSNVYNEEHLDSKKVIQVDIPNEDGSFITYRGDEAKKISESLKSKPEISESLKVKSEKPILKKATNTKYERVVQIGKDTLCWGKSKMASDYAINRTSVPQSKSFTISSTQSTVFSAGITSVFKELIQLGLGASKTKTVMFSQQVTVNVSPNKKAWVEFAPRLSESIWECQICHLEKNGKTNEVIIDSIVGSEHVTTPIERNLTFAGKTFDGPDGAFIWYESDLKDGDVS